MTAAAGILLHGFGARYDLPIARALYLYAAGGVVFLSFVLVVLFAGEKTGERAITYPRRAAPWLLPVARSPWPRLAGGAIGVIALIATVICGFFGPANNFYNPAEYIVWIFFWAMTVIVSGLVGNLWHFLNPWSAIYDAVTRFVRVKPRGVLPNVGVWPAAAAYFAFACLELTSGMASRPVAVAVSALVYTAVTLAGMLWFGRDEWLEHCEAFTVLFSVVARFGPVETERDPTGAIQAVYLRPWGFGLLKGAPAGWDWVVFVILMLSTLAFDGVSATPAWQDFTVALKPFWLPLGAFGLFLERTLGLVLLTVGFLLIFMAFMEAVMYLGRRKVDVKITVSTFALTLVPIALVYNAAHNYSYILVNSQYFIPLLDDPLGKGWHLLPAVAGFKPNFALAQASTVWYADIILIVLGHIVAVFLSHLRAGERFRTAQRALLSQYPMLLLMVMYTMTSLWILSQPITLGG
ncbi:MAG TPA: hypothetical protein VFL27_02880 [Candidatus Dormibacteraeota bacterium]|nr:hypothetical protein [Candidatus Dormibacteraeota bacterium]